jgi:hypothetical protein
MPSTVGIVASGQNFPLSLNPALWLDAADTTTITQSGGLVSQWNDKSGNTRNFAQSIGAQQPTTGTRTINSLNVLDFNGANRLNKADDAGMRPSAFTTFIVYASDTTSGRRDIFACGNAATFATNNWIMGQTNVAQGFFGRTPTTNLTSGTVSGDTLARWVHNGSTLTGALNSVATFNVSSTIGTDNTLGQFVGASSSSGNLANPFDGTIGEILFYPTVLTANEIINVETYLSAKWGI